MSKSRARVLKHKSTVLIFRHSIFFENTKQTCLSYPSSENLLFDWSLGKLILDWLWKTLDSLIDSD